MRYIKMIFISALTLFSILGTTSFASVTMTVDQADQILDYFAENLISYNSSGQNYIDVGKQIFQNFDRQKFTDTFNNNFNNKINYTGEFDFKNISVIAYMGDDDLVVMSFILSNNTASNDLDYLRIRQDSYSGYYSLSAKDTSYLKAFRLYLYKNLTVSNSYEQLSGLSLYPNNILTIDNEQLYYPTILALSPTQVVYYKGNDDSTYTSKFLGNYLNFVPPINIPDEPSSGDTGESGDTGGGTGGDTGGGTITPDYSEDLNEIKNELNNIKENIPTSGEIAGATTQGNKEFWGSEENIKEEDFENQIETEINGIMDNMSGEITQNQIFSELQSAENGFLNFFKEEQEEQFYDLAFNWEEVQLYGTTLIPAGGINISQMCREIESLGKLQTLIRTISCFSFCIMIIIQIYNLVLSTLGIDNPYLYEDGTQITNINMDTGEYTQTMRKTKRKL